VSTKDLRTCLAAKVTKNDYKRELAIKNQKIRQLEAELAVSKRLKYAEEHVIIWSEVVEQDQTSHIHDIKTRIEEANQRQVLNVREMRDELMWYSSSDDCDCKQQVSAVADLLKKYTEIYYGQGRHDREARNHI
jgi:hypothetical protein